MKHTVSLLVLAASLTVPAIAADKPTPAEREQRKAVVREVLERQRQKPDTATLDVYLKKPAAIYVNGKSLRARELTSVARKAKADTTVITAGPGVGPDQVAALRSALAGSTGRRVVVASGKAAAAVAAEPDDRIAKVLARQEKKGDTLGVYLRGAREVFINGTQVPLDTVPVIARRSGAKTVVITRSPDADEARVRELKKTLRPTGLRVKTAPPQ